MSVLKKMPLIALIPLLGLTQAEEAKADRVSASASVRIGGGVHIDIGSALEAIADIGIGISVQTRSHRPPPPPPPVVHVAVVPPLPVVHVAVAPPPPPRVAYTPATPITVPRGRRWGIGLFGGLSGSEGQEEAGEDIGLFGQYELSNSLSLELEIAKTEYVNGARVDRSLGGAVLWDLSHRKLSPYLLLGAGLGDSDIGNGDFQAQHSYAELGVGLRYRIGPSFQFLADFRGGVKESGEEERVYKASKNSVAYQSDEDFSRFRFGGMISF